MLYRKDLTSKKKPCLLLKCSFPHKRALAHSTLFYKISTLKKMARLMSSSGHYRRHTYAWLRQLRKPRILGRLQLPGPAAYVSLALNGGKSPVICARWRLKQTKLHPRPTQQTTDRGLGLKPGQPNRAIPSGSKRRTGIDGHPRAIPGPLAGQARITGTPPTEMSRAHASIMEIGEMAAGNPLPITRPNRHLHGGNTLHPAVGSIRRRRATRTSTGPLTPEIS